MEIFSLIILTLPLLLFAFHLILAWKLNLNYLWSIVWFFVLGLLAGYTIESLMGASEPAITLLIISTLYL